MQLLNLFAQTQEGDILPGASCRLLVAGTDTLVNGLTDKDGNPITNPFLADGNGLAQFRAPNGEYDFRVVSGSLDYRMRVMFFDGAQFEADLANVTDPAKGAGMVGLDGRILREYIKQQEHYLTVEHFGVTGAANDSAVWQAAVDYCAANNILLRCKLPMYFIDQVVIPSNLRMDLGNSWLVRISGTSPKDMLINADTTNGNAGIDLRNFRLDGRRTLNSLSRTTAAHRFCGLRLVKCSGTLLNIRADNTVNNEIQAEGNRAGIMLDQSVDIKAFNLFADGTDGSGVFSYQGKNYILGVWAKNNTGSGFTSYGCDDNDFHHVYSDGSGYSGVSVNGERMRCSYLCSKNSPLNYAGVNIGHDTNGNRASGSIINNVVAESSGGYGIYVNGSTGVSGGNWRTVGAADQGFYINKSPWLKVKNAYAEGSVSYNMRVIDSPNLDIDYTGKGCQSTDVLLSGAGEHFGEFKISGAAFSGLNTQAAASAGCRIIMKEGSHITGCGTGGGTTGAVNASANTAIIVRGEVINNLIYGVISNGSSALADIRGARVSGNTSGNFFTNAGGVISHQKVRTSDDAMSGQVTATASSATITVTNANAQAIARVKVWPGNAAAVTNGIPFVSAVSAGVSFTLTLPSAAAGTEVYYWEII